MSSTNSVWSPLKLAPEAGRLYSFFDFFKTWARLVEVLSEVCRDEEATGANAEETSSPLLDSVLTEHEATEHNELVTETGEREHPANEEVVGVSVFRRVFTSHSLRPVPASPTGGLAVSKYSNF